MAKLIRVVEGEIIDFFLDVRPKSKTFGQINGYHLKNNKKQKFSEWVFVPFGFAHGVLFLEEGVIEYLCDASWNQQGELSINIFDKKINWSLADQFIKKTFEKRKKNLIISDKDKKGMELNQAKEILNPINFGAKFYD